MEITFKDRQDAGRFLARRLQAYAHDPSIIVLALPRGGVPVAYEIAQALEAPLDVFMVRKLGVPRHGELAMGAIASGGVRVLNTDIIQRLGITPDTIDAVAAGEQEELERREREYRGDRPLLDVRDRTVILVDDGLATGATMRAAVRALRQQAARKIVVAVPVGSPETCRQFETEVEQVICGMMPEDFTAVGFWYEDFSQTSDAEVHQLLEEAARHQPADRPLVQAS